MTKPTSYIRLQIAVYANNPHSRQDRVCEWDSREGSSEFLDELVTGPYKLVIVSLTVWIADDLLVFDNMPCAALFNSPKTEVEQVAIQLAAQMPAATLLPWMRLNFTKMCFWRAYLSNSSREQSIYQTFWSRRNYTDVDFQRIVDRAAFGGIQVPAAI